MKIPRLQSVIAAMLFLATMINYLDRVALGVVSVRPSSAIDPRVLGIPIGAFGLIP